MLRLSAICASFATFLLTASSAHALSPFMIFFDFDSIQLDDYAHVVMDNAAKGIIDFDARVSVSGFADRAGSSAYNLRLSRLRADAVKAALVAKGVRGASITVEARGEHGLLVDTADGVSERQNRYAQILYIEACLAPPPGRMLNLPQARDC